MVSIIIPNYNHARFLQERIQSVLYQTYQNFEIILLDDCSTDQSRAIIELYRFHPKVSHIVYNDQNSGSTFRQWSKGVALSKGKYIWIAESDDFCDKNFLETALNYLSGTDSSIFYSKSVRIDEQNNILDELEWWYKDLSKSKWLNSYTQNVDFEIKKYLIKKNTIVNASAVVFENSSYLPTLLTEIASFKYAGDWLFWLSVSMRSKKIIYSSSVNNYFRTHQNTTRSNITHNRNIEILRIYKWICTNVLKVKDDKELLFYYIKNHLKFFPKKHLHKNLLFAKEMAKYTAYNTSALVYHYIN